MTFSVCVKLPFAGDRDSPDPPFVLSARRTPHAFTLGAMYHSFSEIDRGFLTFELHLNLLLFYVPEISSGAMRQVLALVSLHGLTHSTFYFAQRIISGLRQFGLTLSGKLAITTAEGQFLVELLAEEEVASSCGEYS